MARALRGTTITASGGAAPYSFGLTAGALPAGMTLTAAGVLSGTPTTAGTATFTIRGTDASGCFAAVAYTMFIPTSVPKPTPIPTPTPTLQPPGSPLNFVAIPVGTSAYLGWVAPDTGGAPTSYIIEAGSATGAANLAMLSTTTLSYSAADVGAGAYYLRVRAVNAAGTGASNEAILVIGKGCSSAPTQPGTLIGSSSGTTVILSWGASSGNPTTYVVEAGSSPALSDLANSDLVSAAPELVASNIRRGVYYIRIRGKNSCGVGLPSNEVTVVVQ